MAIDRRLLTYINWGLVAATLLLFWVGIGNLYSASGVRVEDGISLAPYYERQMIWGAFGLIAMVACMSFDYRHLQAMALPFFLIVLFSLCLIPLFGKVIYGARRWIDLGFFHFQPSEMAKIAVLLMGAQVLSLDGEPLSWKKLFQVSCVGGIPAAFIVCQPDLGTALTVLAILGGMILYHGLKKRVLLVCLISIPLLLPMAWFALHDYQKQRIMTFLDPSNDPRGAGYHIIQSKIAIGSGQIWRKADLSRGGAACPIVSRDLHGGSAGGDRFVCRTYSGSLFGDHGGCFFVPQCSGRDRGVRDLAMCQLRDRAGRVLK